MSGVAPAAMQMGTYVGRTIRDEIAGRPRRPFRYLDKGTMATIGRNAAVAVMGKVKLSGFPAWLVWLVAHIYFLINFRNRVIVLIDWDTLPRLAAEIGGGDEEAPLLGSAAFGTGVSAEIGDPSALLRAAWDLDNVEKRYLAFIEQHPHSYRFLMQRALPEQAAAATAVSDTIRRLGNEVLREVAPDCDPIRTHRGLGYSLDATG